MKYQFIALFRRKPMFYDSKPGYLERADYTWSEDSIRFINTPSFSARQTFFYVQEAGFFKTDPPYFTERANLKSFLIFYTLSGEGTLSYLDDTYRLTPGSAAFINCINHHYYECVRDSSWEFLWVHINGSSTLGYYEEFTKNGFHILTGKECAPAEQSIRSILSLLQAQHTHTDILVSNQIVNLLTILLTADESYTENKALMPDYLKKALKTIENRFTENLNLEVIAREAGVSKYHLSRIFKSQTGITVKEYIILKRINYAKELLRYSDKTVEEIGYMCGFNHTSHFISMFKAYEDTTPKHFRMEWGG